MRWTAHDRHLAKPRRWCKYGNSGETRGKHNAWHSHLFPPPPKVVPPNIPPDCLTRWWLRVWFTLIKLDIHNPDRQTDPEIRSRGKEQGHESSKGWQLQVSEIKVTERNLLIGPFLHSTPNSITIYFRHLTCHGEEGPLKYKEACPFKFPGW